MTKQIARFMNLHEYETKNGKSELSTERVDAFIEGHLFFQQLESLNDPFEGAPVIDMEKINSLDLKQAVDIFKGTHVALATGVSLAEVERMTLNFVLRHESISAATSAIRRYLGDKLYQQFKQDFQKIGVCCFLEVGEKSLAYEPLMWSLYAAGLKGVRVEFDTDILISSLDLVEGMADRGGQKPTLDFENIEYSDIRPRIDWLGLLETYCNTDSQQRRKLLMEQFVRPHYLVKSDIWSNESEYRIIAIDGAKKLIPFDTKAISSISLGFRCEKVIKDRIVRTLGSECPIFEVKPCESTYSLLREQIN